MAGILYTLITKKLVKRWFIDKYSYGFDELQKYILGETDGVPKTPAWAEQICGVSSTKIEEPAVSYGSMHPVALIPGASIQRTLGGEEAIRMAVVLQTATGNLGAEGGSPGALAFGTLPRPRVGSVPIPANPAGASIPVYRWAEVILEGRAGGFPTDIKAIYNVGVTMSLREATRRRPSGPSTERSSTCVMTASRPHGQVLRCRPSGDHVPGEERHRLTK